MKCLVYIFLLCVSFLTARSEQEEICINDQSDLESSLLDQLQGSDTLDQTAVEEAEKAFVPDLFNTSSFLVPRLVYVLFTCNSSQDVHHAIDNERAFVWTNQYLFVYMHPAVIRLVSLLDLTLLLGPSVHTLMLCVPDICSNATEVSFEEAILKVSTKIPTI